VPQTAKQKKIPPQKKQKICTLLVVVHVGFNSLSTFRTLVTISFTIPDSVGSVSSINVEFGLGFKHNMNLNSFKFKAKSISKPSV
jgi:hypothetical protein